MAAAVAFVRVVAGLGSAAVWIGGIAAGVIAILMMFIGVVLVAALIAKTPELQRYRLRLLRELLQLVKDLLRGWGKR